MKPKPLLTLKDRTIPVGMSVLLARSRRRADARAASNFREAWNAPGGRMRSRDSKRFDRALWTFPRKPALEALGLPSRCARIYRLRARSCAGSPGSAGAGADPGRAFEPCAERAAGPGEGATPGADPRRAPRSAARFPVPPR